MFRGLLAAMLLLHVAIGVHTAVSKSVTHDELWHLPVGLLNLRNGQFHYDRLNPPLARMWAALPLWIAGVDAEPGEDGPQTGAKFVQQHPNDFQRYYVWGRLFNLGFSVATACLLAWWALRLFGQTASLLTTLLYCTGPSIVANASLVTPDIGLTFAYLATLFALWRWTQARTWRSALVLGLLLGLAQAIKFTAVLLYPLSVLLWLILSEKRAGRRAIELKNAGQLVAAFALSLVVLNAAYLFRGTCSPLHTYAFRSTELRTLAVLLRSVDGLPVPVPRDYLQGLDDQRTIMQSPHPVFLNGEWSLTGFRDYYWRAFLYKTPHPLQVLFMLSGILVIAGRCGRRRLRVQTLLLLPVLLLLAPASTTAMQLGFRYVLPALPLLMLFAGQCGSWLAPKSRAVRWGLGTLIAVTCLASLRYHPHHLAYFNEYAGGPVQGRYHLLDSNLDWGQDLNLVKEFMDKHDLDTIGLAYFGTVPPGLLGIDFSVPPSRQPQPGWYAVSVNYVMGRPHMIPEPDGTWRAADVYEFGYFRAFEPVERLGYSIDIYHIPSSGSFSLR